MIIVKCRNLALENVKVFVMNLAFDGYYEIQESLACIPSLKYALRD